MIDLDALMEVIGWWIVYGAIVWTCIQLGDR
jgi:hypothetical protein